MQRRRMDQSRSRTSPATATCARRTGQFRFSGARETFVYTRKTGRSDRKAECKGDEWTNHDPGLHRRRRLARAERANFDFRELGKPSCTHGKRADQIGKLNAKATNGPITIQDFTGDGDLRAQNGPISIFGSSGNLRVHTENGPITVALRSTTWTGAGLTADAENGPVTLQVPAGFQSSFLVESNGNGPVSCAASICGESRKTWDDDRKRIEFGSAPPVIHLSSYNGPVSVRNARE